MANRKLIFQEKNLIDTPFEVLITAHWRPQDAQLKKEFKKESIRKDEKEYERLKIIWKEREVWINICLDLLMLSTPKETLANVFNTLLGYKYLEPAKNYKFDTSKGLGKWIGVPDFVLKDEMNNVLCGEIKIAAIKTNHKYSFQQYRKYLSIGALYLLSPLYPEPKQIRNIVILPTDDLKSNILDYFDWKPQLKDNTLKPFVNKNNGTHKRLVEDLKELLQYEKIAKSNEIEYKEVISRIYDLNEQVPTYIYSWSKFLNVYYETCRLHCDDRFLSYIERLKTLTSNFQMTPEINIKGRN